MRIALLTSDGREVVGKYDQKEIGFGTAPEALMQGFARSPEVEVHVISCLKQSMPPLTRLSDNVWHHTLRVPRMGWLRTGYQGCIRAVRQKLRELQPDIVHGQGTERDCAISAVFSGFPNVVTIHGNMAELARLFNAPIASYEWLTAKLERIALKRTKGVFCNSEYTENLVRLRTVQTWRVPNAIRAPFFDAPKIVPAAVKCTLINVGVISERKRQVELLNVARRLHALGLSFELQFIGSLIGDAYGVTFAERVKEAETNGYARYLGLKTNAELIDCFDAAHGLIHFPSEEAFGLVVAEALARGLKCFGARLGGIIDISTGLQGAELFAPDDWDGLTSGISNWIHDGFPKPTETPKIIRQRYHPVVIARRHLEIYQEVLSKDS